MESGVKGRVFEGLEVGLLPVLRGESAVSLTGGKEGTEGLKEGEVDCPAPRMLCRVQGLGLGFRV